MDKSPRTTQAICRKRVIAAMVLTFTATVTGIGIGVLIAFAIW